MQIINHKSQIDLSQIEDFIFSHPNSNFFQSTKAFNFFCSAKNYYPYLIVYDKKEKIAGTLLAVFQKEGAGLKGYFSRRCIVWGAPLAKNNNPQIVKSLLFELNKLSSSKSIYTEFRNLNDTSIFNHIFSSLGYKYHKHLNYIVHIDDKKQAFQSISSSKKRQIKKSLKNGAAISEAKRLDEVDAFYKILKKLYKKKVKKPLPDFNFFKTFYENKEYGVILLVSHNERIIGGIMCPIYKDTIYEWYVCGLDNVYKNIYPSILATWAPIELAAQRGLVYFDFLGAGKPNDSYGVREFKSKFGGELVEFGRFFKVNNSLLYRLGRLGLRLLKISKS